MDKLILQQKSKEQEVVHTFCSFCGKCLDDEETQGRFKVCKHCGVFIPIGANSYFKLMKGGDKNMAQEKAVKKAEAKKEKSAKEKVAKEVAPKVDYAGEAKKLLESKDFAAFSKKDKLKINKQFWLQIKALKD